jgi:hypothetical protein
MSRRAWFSPGRYTICWQVHVSAGSALKSGLCTNKTDERGKASLQWGQIQAYNHSRSSFRLRHGISVPFLLRAADKTGEASFKIGFASIHAFRYAFDQFGDWGKLGRGLRESE